MDNENTKKKKRWVGIAALAMALVVFLAACSKGCTTGSENSEGTASESAAVSSEDLTTTVEDTTDEELTTTGEVDETGVSEDSTDVSEDSTVEVPEDTSSEPETTEEEAAQTLPEESSEEAATTLEGSTENTEPAATTTKEKETTKAPSSQNPTPGAATTAAPPETTKATTAPTQPTTPPPTTTAAPTQPSHKHSYTGKVTKAATCGTAGVMTYTCSCGSSYTEPIPATGNHNWVEQFKTVHHDAITRTIHHDAETHIVHHDAVTHQQWVTDQPAYDEPITEMHAICNSCGADLTIMQREYGEVVFNEHGSCYFPSWHDEPVVIGYTHHDEVGHYETVVDTPAWDETVIDKPAWDEVIVEKEAWDETVHDCYKCSVCGATKP